MRRLAAGVARNYSNILTVVLGSASLALEQVTNDPSVTSALRRILRACNRAAVLNRQLLAHSGQGLVARRPCDVAEVVREAVCAAAVTGPPRALAVKLDLQPSVVIGDRAQLRQAVVNLLLNASEAIGHEGGVVRIRTRVREIAEGDLTTPVMASVPSPGRYVLVDVTDTGPGIPPEVLSRVFEPFFSTKYAGRGLGLAEVLGVVRGHGGAVVATSTVDVGTTVRIFLPTSASPA